MWISSAMAQDAAGAAAPAAAAAPGGDLFGLMVPMLVVFMIFYFVLIRPQQKAVRAEADMRKGVKRGDMVQTTGGLIVKVAKVDEDELQVEIAPGVTARLARSGIAVMLDANGRRIAAPEPLPAHKKKPAA